MKYILYSNGSMIKFADKTMELKEFLGNEFFLTELLVEKYDLLNRVLGSFFNYDEEKYFMYFYINMCSKNDVRQSLEVIPYIYLNYYVDDKYTKIKENLLNTFIEKSFYDFKDLFRGRAYENLKLMSDYEIVTNNDLDYNLDSFYIVGSYSDKIRYFKNKILYYLQEGVDYNHDVNKYLEYDIDYSKEILEIEKETISKKVENNVFFKSLISKKLFPNGIDYGNNGDNNNYEKILMEIYDEVKNLNIYKELVDWIHEHLKSYLNNDLDFKKVEAAFNKKGYYYLDSYYEQSDDYSIYIVDDEKIKDEDEIEIKKALFEKELNLEFNSYNAIELIKEYIDTDEFIEDFFKGTFYGKDPEKEYYRTVVNEIVEENDMDLKELLNYAGFNNYEFFKFNKSFTIYLKS